MSPLVHSSCVAVNGYGLLLRGSSGSGKSTLALRLIDEGADLVGDDYCVFETRDGALWVRPQPILAGLIEVRGLGPVCLPHRPQCKVHAVFEMCPWERQERFPAQQTASIVGVNMVSFCVDPFEAAATAKVRLALKVATETIGIVA